MTADVDNGGGGSAGAAGTLALDYAAALRLYAAAPDESILSTAYELGRTALEAGLGVLHVAHVHSRALPELVEPQGPERRRALEAAEKLLREALSPFEMAHRGFRDANAALRRLNDLLEAQSRRIAAALHDEAAQLLVPVHLAIAEASLRVPADVRDEFDRIRGLLTTIEERLRELSHELRPPLLEQLGLAAALELLCSGVSQRWQIEVRLHAASIPRISPTIETTLYRVVQEALTNVVRHASATEVEVSVEHTGHAMRCSIVDNGRGCDARGGGERGLGLQTIDERVSALGGTLRIEPAGGCGTALTVAIPVDG